MTQEEMQAMSFDELVQAIADTKDFISEAVSEGYRADMYKLRLQRLNAELRSRKVKK